ncbi:MAG: glycosyltransferase [Candidatus Babeliales bacterium]|nr:glycosyltransferase [Candidatus Babeliales bacterium]
MKMLSCMGLFFCVCAVQLHGAITDLDFDISMQSVSFKSVINAASNQAELGMSGDEIMKFFRDLYNKHKPSRVTPSQTLKIPKIIHQIWIGNSVPSEFKEFQASCKRYHPDWEYRLWTQDDIPALHMRNDHLVRRSRNPGEISDLMRYEILYRYGGVYLDFDCECLQSLEALHYLYDFYIGIQPLDSDVVQLGIGIIGSVPYHPMLKQCIESIGDTWDAIADKTTARTGPLFFTKIFYRYAAQDDLCNIAFPATYFYPLGCKEYGSAKTAWAKQGSFAVHHWAKSWLLPSFRRQEFQTIKNY